MRLILFALLGAAAAAYVVMPMRIARGIDAALLMLWGYGPTAWAIGAMVVFTLTVVTATVWPARW